MKLFWVIIIIWLVGGLYFSTAGYVYVAINFQFEAAEEEEDDPFWGPDSVRFNNMAEYYAVLDKKEADNFYILHKKIPKALVPILSFCAFGLLGALAFSLKIVVVDRKEPTNIDMIGRQLLGVLTGIIILGLGVALPEFENAASGEKYLLFMSLMAGFFSEGFFEWLKKKSPWILASTLEAREASVPAPEGDGSGK